MMNNPKRLGIVGLLLSGTIAFGATKVVVAQDAETKQETTAKTRNVNSGRDPFKKYEPPKVVIKRIAGEVMIPSIQERINMYKAQKQAAMNARMPAPKPTTALLLNEIQVIGITRTPRGYAAIVEATPIKLSYVIYPGEPFYDGQLVAIEDKSLIFRHETIYTDGRRAKNVETKLLRQPSQVNAMVTAPSSDAVAAKP
ncbi:MAG TPA: hypothetical protein VGP85_19335 [Pyrinomonadaceae bacterium]|jgi:hypothetical protein|nr:hypothetical protein [Pyrinomonadaceae bacterium]